MFQVRGGTGGRSLKGFDFLPWRRFFNARATAAGARPGSDAESAFDTALALPARSNTRSANHHVEPSGSPLTPGGGPGGSSRSPGPSGSITPVDAPSGAP